MTDLIDPNETSIQNRRGHMRFRAWNKKSKEELKVLSINFDEEDKISVETRQLTEPKKIETHTLETIKLMLRIE